MSYLLSIGTAEPTFEYHQKTLLGFMQEAMLKRGFQKESRILAYIYRVSGITTRYSVLPDFGDKQNSVLFKDLGVIEPSTEERMAAFNHAAEDLLHKACLSCLEGQDLNKITHIITVTCTGLTAPGLEIAMIERLGLPNDIYKSSVNFMGCYGAFHAMRQADYICKADPNARVLIADIELCTLHFQVQPSEDNMIANSIFSDGAAAALVGGENHKQTDSLTFGNFYSQLVPAGKKDMAWHITSKGFDITLSSFIPELIKANLYDLMTPAVKKEMGMTKHDDILWAFHPGGRRILDTIVEMMGMEKEALQHSYDILAKYGNMSSVTILFVLKSMWQSILTSDKPVFAAGFGPGLSMEAMTLTR